MDDHAVSGIVAPNVGKESNMTSLDFLPELGYIANARITTMITKRGEP